MCAKMQGNENFKTHFLNVLYVMSNNYIVFKYNRLFSLDHASAT
jgi:hypothetical protein